MYKSISINKNKSVNILDQRLLPFQHKYIKTSDYKEVIKLIKSLAIRGAPAIGVAGAFACFFALKKLRNKKNYISSIEKSLNQIEKARPTAVNLSWSVERFRKIMMNNRDLPYLHCIELFYKEANKIYNEEKKVSERISINGLRLIRNNYKILTHCNTGALATTGPGTALGIIDYANKKFENINLYATETRPLNQGSRLTVWESSMKGIDCTLICDSMVSYIINSENIDIIIVGADRIAMNGDIANKIGTYQLAITANYHKIPFYVAAPISTFDMDIVSGDDIIIEERSRDEILKLKNIRISKAVKVQNPAFDVTPNNLISGIVTEKGIITKPNLKKIKKFFK
tara:strand:- start:14053 stop:15081 length:1029 start_codon:yes stop_codon:yes gene_type:complete